MKHTQELAKPLTWEPLQNSFSDKYSMVCSRYMRHYYRTRWKKNLIFSANMEMPETNAPPFRLYTALFCVSKHQESFSFAFQLTLASCFAHMFFCSLVE